MMTANEYEENVLVDHLCSDAPAPDLRNELALFGQFVGSWKLDWQGWDSNRRQHRALGELHFGWVLGGSAVQDTWIVPARGEPGHRELPFGFHGTTVRFYDAQIGAWRSTWINPLSGSVRCFIGRPVQSGIELLSTDKEPHLHWSFSEITATAFVWQAQISHDGGQSWQHHERMDATRL